MQRWAVAAGSAFVVASAAHADTVNTRERQVRELAPGVYTIRHADPTDDFPDGNTTVVIGEREVLVVDTCYLPSSADADIAQIRRWTDKPVRWVLNTHWHYDHVDGNHRYRLAWPGAEVTAHEETRRMIDSRANSYVRRFVAPESSFGKQREACVAPPRPASTRKALQSIPQRAPLPRPRWRGSSVRSRSFARP